MFLTSTYSISSASSKSDDEFKIFLEDMMTIREGGRIKFNKYGKRTVDNPYVGLIEHVRQLTKNLNLKESQDVKYITLNNMRVYKNLPIISKKSVNVGDKDLGQQIRNNEEFEVMDFDNKTITIKSEITNEIINSPLRIL